MKYPHGRCGECGARVYAHVDGGYQCFNCDARYLPIEETDGNGGAAISVLKA